MIIRKSFIFLSIVACTLTGCNTVTDETSSIKERFEDNVQSEEQKETTQLEELIQSEEATQPEEKETAFPGSYTVPDGWVKAEEHSTDKKFFYVEEGHETDKMPDNISINIGTNRYSAEDHTSFRDAIVQQLLAQLNGVDAELLGDGTSTEQGYIVYIFTINERSTGVVTKQYYIVDDYQFCLIHLTNYTNSENANEAAQAIVDSFVWEY